MDQMKQKEKLLFYFASGIVMLAGVFLFARFVSLATFENKAALKNEGQVLGASIDARGELPIEERLKFELPALPEKLLQKVNAESYIVFDLDSGQVLAEKNSKEQLPIASLTKLMTGYVAYLNLDFSKICKTFPKKYWQVGPFLNLEYGDEVKSGDLFESMLVGSANDAAFALAQCFESKTDLDFVNEMNAQAKILNMENTSYSNPAGFDSVNNFSSAEDLKNLISKVFKIPVFNNLSRKTSYSFESENKNFYKVQATNKLIDKYSDILAVKTGYTKSSLGSMATVVEVMGKQIVVIVLDTETRESDTLKIRQAILEAF